jgi:hypothetical protein
VHVYRVLSPLHGGLRGFLFWKEKAMYYDIQFKGIYTHDPEEAIRKYQAKMGCDPTVIIIRPEFPVRVEHPLLVRSVAGTAVYMLVTHTITMEDVQKTEAEWRAKQSEIMRKDYDRLSSHNYFYQHTVHSSPVSDPDKPHKPPLPQKATCPHCKQVVNEDDFENLGWWWGWNEGITPPYWNELRIYVFRRDDWKCSRCDEIYPAEKLNAHHITPKENGGVDSAKNLRSMCIYCHEDLKPILPAQDESG